MVDGLNTKTIVRINKYIFLILLLIGCQKEELVVPDPVEPPCEIDYSTLQTGINLLTCHYESDITPFVDYADKLGVTLAHLGSFTIWSGHGDFNNNETSDYVMVPSDWTNTSVNEVVIVIDDVIAHAFPNPQTFTRKVTVTDLNQDGVDDIVLFGTGEDIADSPGDETVVIYMYPGGNYSISEIGTSSGYYHTGAVGLLDGNNLSIIEIDAQAFTKGGFVKYLTNNADQWIESETNITTHHVARTYQSELYDFDRDGILDLILGGAEWEEAWMETSLRPVQWRTHILKGLGNGQFDIENPTLLPIIPNWGVITDFDMYDIDGDGSTEIMVTRTTGKNGATALPIDNEFYDGILIQILDQDSDGWYESQRIEQPSSVLPLKTVWAYNTMVYDVNMDCLLDLVPQSDKLNSASYAPFNTIRGLYYEQQSDGTFKTKYKS